MLPKAVPRILLATTTTGRDEPRKASHRWDEQVTAPAQVAGGAEPFWLRHSIQGTLPCRWRTGWMLDALFLLMFHSWNVSGYAIKSISIYTCIYIYTHTIFWIIKNYPCGVFKSEMCFIYFRHSLLTHLAAQSLTFMGPKRYRWVSPWEGKVEPFVAGGLWRFESTCTFPPKIFLRIFQTDKFLTQLSATVWWSRNVFNCPSQSWEGSHFWDGLIPPTDWRTM